MRHKIGSGIVIGALALLMAAGRPTAAQEGTPPPASAVDRYVPAATALGPGWVIVHRDDPRPSPELFRAGAKAAYGGPNGARAVVFAWIVADERAAPRAWAAASQLMEGYRSEFAPEADASALLRLQAAAPPGCAAVARAEGIDPASEFRAGLTLCAVGAEAIVLAVVSGDLGSAGGATASDYLVELAVGSVGVATPAP